MNHAALTPTLLHRACATQPVKAHEAGLLPYQSSCSCEPVAHASASCCWALGQASSGKWFGHVSKPASSQKQTSQLCLQEIWPHDLCGEARRSGIEAKRSLLESLQKRCSAAQAKLEGEYTHLGSLEAKTKELENIRKVPNTAQCTSVYLDSIRGLLLLFPTVIHLTNKHGMARHSLMLT